MTLTLRTLILGVFVTTASALYAQSTTPQGGQVIFNPSQEACLSAEDHERYTLAVAENKALLDAQGTRAFQPTNASQQVLFDWPVRQADVFDYASTWGLSNYVDHDPATGQVQDWNCGTRTYDTESGYDHTGLDIYTWPFSWKQMDDNQTEVIAAQAGQIIYKNDGEFDKNCSFSGTQWNAIYIEHSDGSVAWYGHLKNGSLNSKNVGDLVSQGEYIGIIGSSGNSTGPHLHFEVRALNNNLIDPYEGPCNDLNTSSWWSSQKEYNNPKINTVLTHNAAPEFFFNECNTTEQPNISEQFEVGESVIVAAYYADQIQGTSASYEVIDPNGAVFSNWSQTFNNTFISSYWYWTINPSPLEGVWTFSATYNEETVTRPFTVGENLSVTDTNPAGLEVFPNPVQEVLNFKTASPIDTLSIRDAAGREIVSQSMTSADSTLDFSDLSSGIYFVTGISKKDDRRSTVQVVKR